MKANAIYTALEVLNSIQDSFPVGEENLTAEEILGNYRVRIGGIPVNKADHLINVPEATDELEVIVGNESYTVDVTENEPERVVSEGAVPVKEAQGAEATKRTEESKEKTA